MKISSEHYLKASLDRIEDARKLYNSGNYVGSIYLSGVSVECMFRAYAAGNTDDFDSRHDLTRLLRASGISEIISVSQRRDIGAALGNIWSRWKNNYRYASEELIRAELKKLKLDRGIKGDWLKFNSMTVLDSALTVISTGAKRWKELQK
jgi:HEPN domain-containing protein